jgi:hypothetical protein
MKFLHLSPLALTLLALTACSQDQDSQLDASNQFQGKTVGHWYETLTLDETLDNSFLKFHQENKDILLGNRSPILPETLRGLWFMDGNPVGDQTFNLASAKPGRQAGEDFYFEVNTPSTFSWTNLEANHKIIGLIAAVNLSYSFAFLDCPADVKAEREKTYGMEDGSCTKEDKQFAIITPMVTTPFGQVRVSPKIAYFDMYLRPKEGDYLVWERRSKVFDVAQKFVSKITSIFRKDTQERDFHRYKFTQVMDGEGQALSSLPKLVNQVKDLASKNKKDLKDFIFYVCYQGEVGCSRNALIEGGQTEIEASTSLTDFGALPIF